MNLVGRHALVGVVQHLVIHVSVEVALGAKDFLNPAVAPARPVMRSEHGFGLHAKPVQGLGDVLRPVQWVADGGASQRVDVRGGFLTMGVSPYCTRDLEVLGFTQLRSPNSKRT